MNNQNNNQAIRDPAAPKDDAAVDRQARKIGVSQPKVEPKPESAPASKI